MSASRNKKVCRICLRADIELRKPQKLLSEFHAELICVAEAQLDDVLYCYHCEHQLQKFLKLKSKCFTAMGILSEQKQAPPNKRMPLMKLIEKLPPSLGYRTNDRAGVYCFEETPRPSSVVKKHVSLVPITDQTITVDKDAEKSTDSILQQDTQIYLDPSETNRPNDNETQMDIESDDDKTYVPDDYVNDDLEMITEEEQGHKATELKVSNINDNNNGCVYSGAPDDHLNLNNKSDAEKINIDDDKNDKESNIELDIPDDYLDDNITDDYLNYIKNNTDDKGHSPNHLWLNQIKMIVNKREIEIVNNNGVSNSGQSVADNEIGKKRQGKRKKKSPKNRSNKESELVMRQNEKKTWNNHPPEIRWNTNSEHGMDRVISYFAMIFSKWGKLPLYKGVTVDKERILDIIKTKLTDSYIRFLYRRMRANLTKPTDVALKTLVNVQKCYSTEYDKVFDITYMNTLEKMRRGFEERQMSEHYIKSPYKCQLCYIPYKVEKFLVQHKQMYHSELSGPLQCTICPVRLKRLRELSRHMATHEAVYRCRRCPMVTYRRQVMLKHYNQHMGVMYKCKQCNTTHNNMSTYFNHISRVHPMSNKHICVICAKAHRNAGGLKLHIIKVHQGKEAIGNDKYKCKTCDVAFVSQVVYMKHVSTTHTAAPGRKPRTKNLLKPKPVYKHTCRLCNAVGTSYGWLVYHFREEHPSENMDSLYADTKGYFCEVCGKRFSYKSGFLMHKTMHDKSRRYCCELCPKTFHGKHLLGVHRLWHFPPTFKCDVCDKSFHTKSNLLNHGRIHAGNRRYKCPICPRAFLHRCAMTQHVNGCHKRIIRVRKMRSSKMQKKSTAKASRGLDKSKTISPNLEEKAEDGSELKNDCRDIEDEYNSKSYCGEIEEVSFEMENNYQYVEELESELEDNSRDYEEERSELKTKDQDEDTQFIDEYDSELLTNPRNIEENGTELENYSQYTEEGEAECENEAQYIELDESLFESETRYIELDESEYGNYPRYIDDDSENDSREFEEELKDYSEDIEDTSMYEREQVLDEECDTRNDLFEEAVYLEVDVDEE